MIVITVSQILFQLNKLSWLIVHFHDIAIMSRANFNFQFVIGRGGFGKVSVKKEKNLEKHKTIE